MLELKSPNMGSWPFFRNLISFLYKSCHSISFSYGKYFVYVRLFKGQLTGKVFRSIPITQAS